MLSKERKGPGSIEDKCEYVVSRAAEAYPSLRSVESELFEFFISDEKMGPRSFTRFQTAYHMFIESIDPLIFRRSGQDFVVEGKENVLLAFSGPSASGKDSILDKVAEDSPGIFTRIITTTTRRVREEDIGNPRYNYVSEALFQDLESDDFFIETVPKGKYGETDRYGTKYEAVEEALERAEPIKIWKGDLYGLPAIEDYIRDKHPEVNFVSAFVIPEMSMGEYCERLEQTRGREEALSYRFPLALWEFYQAAELVDCIVLNPTDPTGRPREAAEATRLLFEHLARKSN